MKILILCCFTLLATQVWASTVYNLACTNNGIYTDLGTGKLDLQTQLTVMGRNSYVLKGGTFSFSIGDHWTNQKVAIKEVANRANYRPRVYHGHAKFPNISDAFFGTVDFIVPLEALKQGQESFEAIFILSNVDDHWGDTVSAECRLIQN